MEITRRQGRVVIVGYVKLDIHPKHFLYREIDLRYSRAYGPGSYHTGYEKGRLDYPFGYVRWTENRNLAELIRLISTGAIDLEPLIGGVYDLEDVQSAFDAVQQRTLGGLAALIRYSDEEPERRATIDVHPRPRKEGAVGISLIGFGNHALAQHLPNLRAMRGVEIRGIASATGRNAAALAEKVDATIITTDIQAVLDDDGTDGVIISTTQPEHYGNLCQAIEANKAILVEKPLVTRVEDFADILRRMEGKDILLTVGLNRRYSPMIKRLRDAVDGAVDSVSYTVTRPFLPPDHWSLDPIDGGGRLISEGEHFVDLCNLLIGQEPISVYARALGPPPEDLRTLCNYAVTIHYETAVANITFDESGSADFPTERITVHGQGPGRDARRLRCADGPRPAGPQARRRDRRIDGPQGAAAGVHRGDPGREELAARLGRRVPRDPHRLRRAGEHPYRRGDSTSRRSGTNCSANPSGVSERVVE